MNHTCLAIFIFLVFVFESSAQKQNETIKNYRGSFCDSIAEISMVYYDSHKRALSVIDTSAIPQKKGNRLVIPYGKDSLVYQDLPADSDGVYICKIVGINKNTGWVLVRIYDEISTSYYLIDQKRVTIDKMNGYPYIYGDKLITLEEEHTDFECLIEVRQKVHGKLTLIFQDSFARCGFLPRSFAISNKGELMLSHDSEYWLVKGVLF